MCNPHSNSKAIHSLELYCDGQVEVIDSPNRTNSPPCEIKTDSEPQLIEVVIWEEHRVYQGSVIDKDQRPELMMDCDQIYRSAQVFTFYERD